MEEASLDSVVVTSKTCEESMIDDVLPVGVLMKTDFQVGQGQQDVSNHILFTVFSLLLKFVKSICSSEKLGSLP